MSFTGFFAAAFVYGLMALILYGLSFLMPATAIEYTAAFNANLWSSELQIESTVFWSIVAFLFTAWEMTED